MALRNRKSAAAPASADIVTSDTLAEETSQGVGAPTETEIDTSDDAVLAALEAADNESPFSEPVYIEADTTVAEVVTEATEEVEAEVEIDEEDEAAVLAALEASDGDAPAAKTKTKAAAKPKAAPAVIRQFCDVADHMDDVGLQTALNGINSKKVAEKAQNVVQAITTGKKLSGFTQLAIKMLTDQGRISSKDLVEGFMKDGKSSGTARAQAQQQTALFKALGIANPDPSNARELVSANNGLVKELALLAA